MNLTKALNEKNRLVRKILEIQSKVDQHNSVIKGETSIYNIEGLFQELDQTINHLIDLKTKIALANMPVQSKIFRLAELKSYAGFLRRVRIKEGKVVDERWNSEVREWESSFGTLDRDRLLETTESKIDDLQIELDRYNFETVLP